MIVVSVIPMFQTTVKVTVPPWWRIVWLQMVRVGSVGTLNRRRNLLFSMFQVVMTPITGSYSIWFESLRLEPTSKIRMKYMFTGNILVVSAGIDVGTESGDDWWDICHPCWE